MAKFVVRGIEDEVMVRLKRRAYRHGHDIEEEVRQILCKAANESGCPQRGLGSRIAARFRKIGLDSDLPALRGKTVRAADFDK